MFVQASKLKLRFQTPKGLATTEDLWDLSLETLNTMAKSIKKQLKDSEEEDYLEEKSNDDIILKLKFDIVRFIMETKKTETKSKKDELAKKIEKERLLEIISKKKNESLETLSIEELEQKLKSL